MDKKYQIKPNWGYALGALAVGIGTISMIDPVIANPITSDSWQLAQIEVNNAPIPLNLRPRTHIPLPESNSNSRNYYRDRYYDQYEHDDRYDYDRDHHYRHTHKESYHRSPQIIIINPAAETYNDGYNYSDSYIRIIRQ